MDYEEAKSHTLLFFLEYLMQHGPQSVQELSCKFGHKNFTKDMQKIVKNRMNGLKRLLSQHPSLFVISDTNIVSVNTYEPVECNLMEETKQFFCFRLQQYGAGSMVPIHALQGHRSQLSRDMRKISGGSTADFTKFLSSFPDTFQVNGDNVSLSERLHRNSANAVTPESISNLGNLISSQVSELSNFQFGFETKLENVCAHNCPQIFAVTDSRTIVRTKFQIITTVSDALIVVGNLLKSVARTGEQRVFSLNCNMFTVRKEQMVTLMSLGTQSGETFLFDVAICPQIITAGGLKTLLECDRIVKVIRDCRSICGHLYKKYHVAVKCVFDILSANIVIEYQRSGTFACESDTPSIHELVKRFCPLNSIKNKNFTWTSRPLKDEMIVYAARLSNLLLKLYGSMASSIRNENMSLLSILCTERVFIQIHHHKVKKQIEARKAYYETEASNRQPKIVQPTKNVGLQTKAAIRYRSASSSSSSNTDRTQTSNQAQLVSREMYTGNYCYECYVNHLSGKQCQTLSTGDIHTKGLHCASSDSQSKKECD